MSDASRRTLTELRTQYELYPSLRDVYVEGRRDRAALKVYLHQAGIAADVYAVGDRVYIPTDEVLKAGFDDGERGRVIVLATSVEPWPDHLAYCVTCVIDRDRADIETNLPAAAALLVTDYGSMEVYCLTPETLRKFLGVVLRLDYTSEDIARLYDDLVRVLMDAFAIRSVLHERGHGETVPRKFPKHRDRASGGMDFKRVLREATGLSGESLMVVEEKARRLVFDTSDVRRRVRGHDIAPVLIELLGLKNHWGDDSVVEGALLGSVEWAQLRNEELFAALTKRLAS